MSYYNDTNSSNLVDVTNNFNGWITYNSDNSVNIQFGHIDGAYIIEVEGKYDEVRVAKMLRLEFQKRMIL